MLFIQRMLDQIYEKKVSAWGVQWTYACLVNDGVAILPRHNMICNIGFVGTHKMNDQQLMLTAKEIDFENIKHLIGMEVDYDVEDILFEKSGLKSLI